MVVLFPGDHQENRRGRSGGEPVGVEKTARQGAPDPGRQEKVVDRVSIPSRKNKIGEEIGSE